MLGCTAIRTAGMQPHFSMIHKKGIWTHSEQINTSSGQRFAFTCFTIISLTVILKNHGSHLENEKVSRWLALIS